MITFLFQVGGYYVVFWAMESHATNKLLSRLDADTYSSDDAIVLSIPMSMPYSFTATEYERVNGNFRYQGESYQLLKQKVENDMLFVVCVKDRENTRITEAFIDFTKFSHNLPVSNKKAMSFLTKVYKDFNSTEFRVLYRSRLMYERVYIAESTPRTSDGSFSIDSPPPELIF